MASELSVDAIADMVKTTINDIRKQKEGWTELTSTLQSYQWLPHMLKRSNIEIVTSHTYDWRVRTGTSGNARFVGLFSTDQTNVDDVWQSATVPMRHVESSYAYDTTELLANAGNEERILSIVKARRSEAWIDLAKLLETWLWSKPADSSDTVTPYGLQYWIVSSTSGTSAATGVGGFNGTDPSGFTAGAGNLSSTDHTQWANYAHQYVDVSKGDLVHKMRRAAFQTDFTPPVAINEGKFRGGMSRGYYAPFSVVQSMEGLLESQNDNLGNDVASKAGKTMLLSTPLTPVPQLGSDTTDPIYQIDWRKFKPIFLRGDYMREDRVKPKAGQHRVLEAHIDATLNTACLDRRSQAVFTL